MVGVLDAGVPTDRLGLDPLVRVQRALLRDALVGHGDRRDAAVTVDRHLVDAGRPVALRALQRAAIDQRVLHGLRVVRDVHLPGPFEHRVVVVAAHPEERARVVHDLALVGERPHRAVRGHVRDVAVADGPPVDHVAVIEVGAVTVVVLVADLVDARILENGRGVDRLGRTVDADHVGAELDHPRTRRVVLLRLARGAVGLGDAATEVQVALAVVVEHGRRTATTPPTHPGSAP